MGEINCSSYQNNQSYQNYPSHLYPAPSAPPVDEPVDANCNLCSTSLDDTSVVTKCHHLFHQVCLQEHMNRGNNLCPDCPPNISKANPLLDKDIWQAKGDCSICYESVGPKELDTVITSCHHLFHNDCLKAWLESSKHKDCPLCRTDLSEHNFKPLLTPSNIPQAYKPSDPVLSTIYIPHNAQPTHNPTVVLPANKPRTTKQPTSTISTINWTNMAWTGLKFGGNVLVNVAQGSWWVTKGLFNGGLYLATLAASKKPLTATEQAAVSANKKLGKLYSESILKLEMALNKQLADIELSITMAKSVYDPSLHSSFVRALKDLAEKVNEQFEFFEIGQKNFYDEGLNHFRETVKDRHAYSNYHREGDYDRLTFFPSHRKAVQLPTRMTDEFGAVAKVIKEAYVKKVQDLKSQLQKQYEDTQLVISKKVSIFDPKNERPLKYGLHHLTKKTEEEFTWLMTGVQNFNNEGLQNFNKTIRYIR